MLTELVSLQLSIITATFTATVILIVLRQSWGPIPQIYTKFVEYVQDSIVINKQLDIDVNNNEQSLIEKRYLLAQLAEHGSLNPKVAGSEPFLVSSLLLTNGMEAILQDDIGRGFTLFPEKRWTLMSLPPVPFSTDTVHLYALYFAGLYFRLTFLFPLRVCLLISSVVWICLAGAIALIFDLDKTKCMYLGTRFARLFNAATGQVASYKYRERRPVPPGIAVTNHLSANDIMTIYVDQQGDECGYTCTGQKHGGLIYPLELMGGKLTSTLWLDRANEEERKNFQKRIIEYSKDTTVYPVLLFPEGFCVNNDVVFQFRKAVFTGDVPIYPIAMKQSARLGDSFWREDSYLPYLFRIMTSWALVVEINYLPSMEMKEGERDSEFCQRVQTAIATHLGVDALPYDGALKRKGDQAKYRSKMQSMVLDRLCGESDTVAA